MIYITLVIIMYNFHSQEIGEVVVRSLLGNNNIIMIDAVFYPLKSVTTMKKLTSLLTKKGYDVICMLAFRFVMKTYLNGFSIAMK